MTKRTTPVSVATLQQHAHDLARAFQARVIESAQLQPHEAFAATHLRAVFASTIVDTTTYAVVLHELGHLATPAGALHPATTGDAANLKRIEEDAAWTWARHYALIWTPEMEAVAQWAEGTYQPRQTPTLAPSNDRIDWRHYR